MVKNHVDKICLTCDACDINVRYNHIDNVYLHHCRLNPPAVFIVDGQAQYHFPEVEDWDWCSKWQLNSSVYSGKGKTDAS